MRVRLASATLVFMLVGRAAGAQHTDCVQVLDHPAAPSVAEPEVDVRQIVRLARSRRVSPKVPPYLYVEITRQGGSEQFDGATVTKEEQTFLRMLTGTARETEFTFSREGAHLLTVYRLDELPWPRPADVAKEENRLCGPQPVNVYPALRREDFPGVRAQWWGAYRVSSSVELGGSMFVRRFGVAGGAELAILRAIGPGDDPSKINPIVGFVEIRYRGSRGYIGGGVRYFPDDEANRDRWRAAATFADELPSFKGRPIWLLLDIRLEERRWNFLKGLRPSFGVRFDLWGSRP